MGDDVRNASWLRREIKRIMPIAQRDDLQAYNELLELQKELETLKNTDMCRRVTLDQMTCKILNEQKERMKHEAT